MLASEVFHVVVLPASVAAIAAFIAWMSRLSAPLPWLFGVGAGYLGGQFALAGRNGWPDFLASLREPRDAVEWLPFAVALSMIVSTVGVFAKGRWRHLPVVLGSALAVALPARLLAGSAYSLKWTVGEKMLNLGVLAIILGALWILLAAARPESQRRLRPLLLVGVCAVAAVVVALSGVFVYGELCGVLAAALAGAYLACPERNLEGAGGVVAFSFGSLVLLSYFYAELTAVNAALLLVAAVAAGGRMPVALESRPFWFQTAVRCALVAVPLMIALAGVTKSTPAETSNDPYAI